MTKEELIACERELVTLWESGKVRVPCHFSGGNEEELIELFKEVGNEDYVFSTHRNHYHALLHGIDIHRIRAGLGEPGGSMVYISKTPPFMSTGIVAGGCGIAVGVAWGLKERGSSRKVWCFVGDGATDEGHFYEAWRYAVGYDLPITFVVEDNNRATETTNEQRWGKEGRTDKIWKGAPKVVYYQYEPGFVHVGTGKYIQF
jgi:TPP-dependent pyruvate/acetoin dehydrogenase alpha subunit